MNKGLWVIAFLTVFFIIIEMPFKWNKSITALVICNFFLQILGLDNHFHVKSLQSESEPGWKKSIVGNKAEETSQEAQGKHKPTGAAAWAGAGRHALQSMGCQSTRVLCPTGTAGSLLGRLSPCRASSPPFSPGHHNPPFFQISSSPSRKAFCSSVYFSPFF